MPLFLFSTLAQASANKPKPGQKSSICYFNLGPKVGQTVDLQGKAKPALLGRPCADGEGNSGIAVLSQEEQAAEEAEEAEEAAAKAAARAAKFRQKSVAPNN
jgi:hypothetical protein